MFPTPSATSYGSNRGGAAGRTGPVRHSLESMALGGLWPTPRASEAMARGKAGRPDSARRLEDIVANNPTLGLPTTLLEIAGEVPMPSLDTCDPICITLSWEAFQTTGALNPTWVEWLMGFPAGWTDCAASATPSSRRSPS